MTFTIVLLPAFMARWRQAHEFADLAGAAKPTRVSNFATVHQGRHQTDAAFLNQFVNDRLVTRLVGQLLQWLLHLFDLGFDRSPLTSQTAQRLTAAPTQRFGLRHPLQPAPISDGPAGS